MSNLIPNSNAIEECKVLLLSVNLQSFSDKIVQKQYFQVALLSRISGSGKFCYKYQRALTSLLVSDCNTLSLVLIQYLSNSTKLQISNRPLSQKLPDVNRSKYSRVLSPVSSCSFFGERTNFTMIFDKLQFYL